MPKGRKRTATVGEVNTDALLMFPEENSLELVRIMVGADLPLETLTEMEQDAMAEIGNIILNACMSALADLFHLALNGTLPVHRFGDTESLSFLSGGDSQMVLVLQVDMTISQQRVQGHILFLLSVASMQSLLDCLDTYLREQGLL